MSQEHGHNLQTVQMLLKKNQVTDLSVEKKNHRLSHVCEISHKNEGECE